MQEITATELKAALDSGDDIQLIDVRQPDEHAFANIEGSILIPMSEVVGRMGEIDPAREAVIFCRSGARSAQVISALTHHGHTGVLKNLAGGILAWSNEVDPNVPRY